MRKKNSSYRLAILVGAAALVLCTPPARADGADLTCSELCLSIQSVTANPNTTGNVFDVLLTNETGASVTIGGFIFEVTTADTGITFTEATTATTVDPYLFAGDSLLGPEIDVVSGGQTLEAADFSASGAGDAIGNGDTLGVGHIFFDVANGAALGPATVSFDTTVTSLSDAAGNNLAYSTTPGAITIQSTTTVPEPATDGLCIFALAGFAFIALRRQAS